MRTVVDDLEDLVVASVALTARALGDVAPDLTFVQWRAMVVLGDSPEGVAVSQLAGDLGAKTSATSRLVGRLRRKGLVGTEKAASDARVTVVRLTDGGRELRDAVMARRRSALEWSVSRGGLAIADAPSAARLARALQVAR